MLNPSTADEQQNDPTVERCERRARAGAYGALVVGNLFAWRSTDPRALYDVADPVGPDNDQHLAAIASEAARVVCAWGRHGALQGRGPAVVRLLAPHRARLACLGVNADGSPKHPLYLPYTAALVPFPKGVD